MLPRILPLLAGLGLLTAAAQARPPRPDFVNLPAYVRALDQSRDPQAVAIRQEIADGPAALARERAAATATGIPLTPEQSTRPMPPPDQNAAPLYQQLTDLRRQKPLKLPMYAQPLGYGDAYTPEQIAAVQQVVDSRRDVFDLLQQAADRPQCLFPSSKSSVDNGSANFAAFAGLRENARELDTEGFLLARQGRFADAVTDAARGLHLAEQTAQQPTILSLLVAFAMDAIALGGMKNILYLAGPNAAVDAQVQQAVAQHRPPLSLHDALAGDVPIALANLDLVRQDEARGLAELLTTQDSPPKPVSLSPADKRFADDVVDAAEAKYLHVMRSLVAAGDLPPLARRAAFAQIAQAQGAAGSDDPVSAVSGLILSVSAQLNDHDDRRLAQEEVIIAGAAVLAQKARTGTFPESLPGDFPDPFTGKSLGYRREGDTGFVVYSVGPDGKFNGGKPGGYQAVPYQSFFRYPGPPLNLVPADMLK